MTRSEKKDAEDDAEKCNKTSDFLGVCLGDLGAFGGCLFFGALFSPGLVRRALIA
jgi:hypothetical protein